MSLTFWRTVGCMTFREKIRQGRWSGWWTIWAAALIVALAVSVMTQSVSANADSAMSPLELAQTERANCQILLAHAGGSAQRARATACIADQNVIIKALTTSPSPTPSSSPTVQPSPSATPSPSPTPTGPVTDCLHRLAACGFPNADNTGPSGALTVMSGNVSLDGNGQVLRDVEVRGCVEVHGAGVHIVNVRIVGDCFYAVRNFTAGLVIEDSELSCGSVNGTAVVDSDFTARRLDIHNCENGFSITANVVVEDSWIHDMEIDNGAHTDGAQINRGATDLTFRHNTLVIPAPGGTSGIISWDESDGPQQQRVLIDGNLISGGTYDLYCPRFDSSDTRVTGNRFGGGVTVDGHFVSDPGGPEFGWSNACTGSHVSAWSGNVRDLTGEVLAAA